MRERRTARGQFLQIFRITPARAGKTLPNKSTGPIEGDHPRSCGKDPHGDQPHFHVMGSPPLVRERHASSSNGNDYAGITPARAGKTRLDKGQVLLSQDHPRSCGKDLPHQWIQQSLGGSPPLVRERRVVIIGIAVVSVVARITPARAGKTR